jgi:indole-3-glycerol phosphate synthase
MNILDKIIVDKEEKSFSKSIIPVSQLEASVFSQKTIISENLKNSTTGIIAEHKRRSPSKAEINYSFTVEEVVKDMKMLVLGNFGINRR